MSKTRLLRVRFCPKQSLKSTVFVLLTHPVETLLKFTPCLKWIFSEMSGMQDVFFSQL